MSEWHADMPESKAVLGKALCKVYDGKYTVMMSVYRQEIQLLTI